MDQLSFFVTLNIHGSNEYKISYDNLLLHQPDIVFTPAVDYKNELQLFVINLAPDQLVVPHSGIINGIIKIIHKNE